MVQEVEYALGKQKAQSWNPNTALPPKKAELQQAAY
jgi:hypothetical protein